MNTESEYKTVINALLQNQLYKLILSSPDKSAFRKIVVTQYDKGFLCEKMTEKQVFHQTESESALAAVLVEWMGEFTQLNAWSHTHQYSVKRTKKGKLLTNRTPCSERPKEEKAHNRKKQYLLTEGMAFPALVETGVMTKDGAVIPAMRDKYKQINRFLELVDDVVEKQTKPLRIVDFGCGKSYLTFILYDYFTKIRGIPVHITGVDLKQDVIAACTRLAEQYGYTGLTFVHGDVADIQAEQVDMVVSLHACDTATDYALYKAIQWNAKYIFAVPCCQHEVNSQIESTAFPLMTGYGIIKERFSALLTDAIRGKLLTAHGYAAQVLEFVDLTHTPKNLLIRAAKAAVSAEKRQAALKEVKDTCRDYSIQPKLYVLLSEERESVI